MIFDKKTGQLLGAHMVGAEVTELIQGYVVAMNLETTEEELMHTDLPASDPVGDDEGSGARRLRPRAEHVARHARADPRIHAFIDSKMDRRGPATAMTREKNNP